MLLKLFCMYDITFSISLHLAFIFSFKISLPCFVKPSSQVGARDLSIRCSAMGANTNSLDSLSF